MENLQAASGVNTHQKRNIKGADQTAGRWRLVCANVVPLQQSGFFVPKLKYLH